MKMVRDKELLFEVDDPGDVPAKFVKDFFVQDHWVNVKARHLYNCTDRSNPEYQNSWLDISAGVFKIVEEDGIEFEYRLKQDGGKLYMVLADD